MTLLLQYTLIFAAVLMLVALGGCFSEHSGVINLGLEGIMVIGALGGALVMRYLPSGTSAFVTILLTLLGSVALGVLFSTLLAVACINFKADQTIVGTAMNMLSVAAATVIVKALNTAVNPDDVSATIQYIEPRKAFSFQIGAFEGNWFMVIAVIALIVAYVTLYKTRFGLRLMACGEHPQAADSVGINVYKMRWAGVLISGVLGGLGGICYILAGVSEWKFENGVAGFGFLALAVMIFGQWKPGRIALAALLFGLFRALSNVYFGFGFLMSLGINVYKMRYAGTTISGALAGMGGFVYALTTANCASNGDVAGFGFLALAVMIFGNWKPVNIAVSSLLFGLFKCIAASYASIDINGDGIFMLAEIGISAHFYRMLPYIVTLLVLAFTSKSSRAPKAEGIPYDKGSR